MFRFKCTACGEWHEGMPSFGALAPLAYYGVPAGERDSRCVLGTDTCVIDEQYFYVRGCLEIPVHGADEPFIWGVWVSLSRSNFDLFVDCYDREHRSHIGPFFGWLSTKLSFYPSTENLKTMAHLRDGGLRPLIELEPTDHPLAIEQREGIDVDRVAAFHAHYERLET